MECREAVSWIHEYLDGTLGGQAQLQLKQHLQACSDCRAHLRDLELTEERIRTLKGPQVAKDLTDRIMNCLPPPTKRRRIFAWLRRHPALTAAALFVVVMFGSLASLWNADQSLMVRTNELEKIEIEGNRVIIPEGQTVHGDLVVENGEIIIAGKLEGNLIVIDGTYTASTANISGKVMVVNQMFDWLWYKIAGLFGTV